ncbi:Por secretion system C-terminal sorting domain-containing protein [Mariniphaga anaerophila]|uniref:Por secretion system C-terminal sorting domain-containing protein n=1 Tax=Mariniphaga anaerophila TaxID=1484053 RepID=A0A1M5CNL4_9BACT|nr:T9SS type A sorting domain-containing protein [Mariniphaga anaerophila]SHF56354.1 Por secretion system C-terminal sorting domain-containing protein [Mariniphaga anaerophila]
MKNLARILIRVMFVLLSLVTSAQNNAIAAVSAGKVSENNSLFADISAHPRLLMSNSDLLDLQQAIAQSARMQQLHDFIITQSDGMLVLDGLKYEKAGKRLLAVSREALRRIFYLSYSYRLTGNSQYLNKAESEINTVCAFADWNPSHYLDVGEMCMAVSIGYDWLYDNLQEATKRNVRKAIVTKAFDTSSGQWFLNATNNWNQVCNAGLVYGALAIFEHEESASVAIIEQALQSMSLPLSEYGPDGNYIEGAMYWRYGTSFQVMMLAALESALGTDYGLSQYSGFMESAKYMMYMSGPTQLRNNYSDCSSLQSPNPAMFWFAKKSNNPSLLFGEKRLLRMNAYLKPFAEDRLLPIALIFGKGIALDKMTAPTEKIWIGRGTTPVVIVRTGWEGANEKYLGIKGGSASTSHAHMDAGSFVYDSDRYRWAMDFGLQSYAAVENAGVDFWNMSQNSERWGVFRLGNKNHNTLSINNQRHNVNGNAWFEEYYQTSAKLGAKIDLTNTLNLDSEVRRATREVSIENETFLKVVDEITTGSGSVDLYWNMVTPARAEIVNPSTIRLAQGGKRMLLKFTSATPFILTASRSTDPGNSYETSNSGTSMVGFDAVLSANSTATFTVTLKEDTQTPPVVTTNYIYLDLPDPNTGLEGNTLYYDESPLGINTSGDAYIGGFASRYGWNVYGNSDIDDIMGKQFLFRYAAMGTTNTSAGDSYGDILSQAGIDRANDGILGVRGGTNGIDPNEGFRLGLDLTYVPPSVKVLLAEVGVKYVGGLETGVVVNRNNTSLTKTFGAPGTGTEVELSGGYINVEDLNIFLNGGQLDQDLASVFSNSSSGSFRIHGFRLKVIDTNTLTGTLLDENKTAGSQSISIWPNPFADVVNVKLNSDSETRIKILDIHGRCLYIKHIKTNGEKQVRLNLSGFSPGIYVCCIENGTRRVSKKIIKK